MKALRCDFCGANLVMDPSREFATCEFCGTKYTKETIQEKIQEIRGSVSISGSVETFQGNTEKERLINNALTNIKIHEYSNAYQSFWDVTKQYPDDYRGWWGLFTTSFEEYFYNGHFNSSAVMISDFQNAISLCKDKSIITSYFDNLAKKYGLILRLTKNIDGQYIDSNLNFVYRNAIGVIDSLTYWLIYCTEPIMDKLSPNYLGFTKWISNTFAIQFRDGCIAPAEIYSKPPFFQGEWEINLSTPTTDDFYKMIKTVGPVLANKLGGRFKCDYNANLLIGNKKLSFVDSHSAIGRWVFIQRHAWLGLDSLLLRQPLLHSDIYRLNMVCQYCGGQFIGRKQKICQKCGKPKDY